MPEIRSFPRTRQQPQKRILLIPVFLLLGGTLLLFIPGLQFFGAILSLTGALTVFLVGMVFADLWAAHRRTQQMIKDREERGLMTEEDEDLDEDPFEEVIGDE
jgi:F0F1-type ATP synthase assembly protein I